MDSDSCNIVGTPRIRIIQGFVDEDYTHRTHVGLGSSVIQASRYILPDTRRLTAGLAKRRLQCRVGIRRDDGRHDADAVFFEKLGTGEEKKKSSFDSSNSSIFLPGMESA